MKMSTLTTTFIMLLAASTVFAWTAPIGIPTPSFPSDLDVVTPSLPGSWTSDQAGFYFIAASGCSDTRTYGNPVAPRCTLPTSPAAGSVVVLNGTYNRGVETIAWTNGTSGNPIWLRAYNTSSKPTMTSTYTFSGSYNIIDSIQFSNAAQDGNMLVNAASHHIMFRNCSYTDTYGTSPGEAINVTGKNIVLYKVTIGPVANWNYSAGDIDRHGVKVDSGAADLWIVDSTLFHCQGDGVQVGDFNNTRSAINRIYIGRNISYENLQFGFWVKNATDVIIAENTIYNMIHHTSWSESAGAGGQYDPAYIWYINNRIYDSINGILIVGSSSGGGGPWYVIGNVFDNIHSNTCNNYDYGVIHYRNEGGVSIINNTFNNVDTYITSAPAGGFIRASGNIFGSQYPSTTCAALNMGTGGTFDYNLYYSDAYDIMFSGNSYSTVSLFASGAGQESHRVTGNPLFTNSSGANFTLQASSLAIGKANPTEEAAYAAFLSRYGRSIMTDRAGTSRPQGTTWDIGAYEYVSGGPVIRYPNAPTNIQVN